jgi:hypothetical protein
MEFYFQLRTGTKAPDKRSRWSYKNTFPFGCLFKMWWALWDRMGCW